METVLLYVLGIVIVAVGLALSIGLHELGHLIPAKRFGVKVAQYMIGFGPTLFSRRKGETEYGFKLIPLGGYISMAGMYPPAKDGDGAARTASTGFFDTLVQDARDQSADTVEAGDEDRVFYKLPVHKRIVIMLGGPVMNLLIAIVLYTVVLCGFGVYQSSTTLGSVSECIATDASQTECTAADPAAPAAAAGLKPGDRLVSIDGTPIESWDQASAIIREHPGDTIAFVVERDGAQVTLDVTPLLTERPVVDANGTVVVDGDGNTVTSEVGFIGVGPASEKVQQPVTAVIPAVWDNTVAVGKIIVTLPQRLVQVAQAAFGGEERDPNGPISVVGVGRLAGEITSLDSAPIADRAAGLIQMLAALNVALFVFNLIPLLPLDGGHVAGAIWEAIRRRIAAIRGRPDPGPVDIAKLIPLTLAIVAVLALSSGLLIYADIVNPVTLG
ncbi:M50 family metallopeptidase [Protaetiibacter mangrovi]|uniref:Site-2 protease family protein n=1 Tax=Protaetiibacter mangrovi TaxID=2970926 RepID=A0ABT1ZFK1_9MICO|nr:site-2 protease family protein [Protaetiibacter mangrovi]MCS0499420.1 site-2 protease family protein [Protaetiibacter mangrovi]